MEKRFEGANALVTGGAGFIGSHLTDALIREGANVTVLDNLSSGHLSNLVDAKDQIRFIEGNIRDFTTCQKAAEGAEYVFHQAAMGSVPRSMEIPEETYANNVLGTANMMAACRKTGVRRFVYASSSSVYGDSTTLPKREGEEGTPLSPYAMSKWMNEELAQNFAKCFNLESVGLRYFNVYGPRQDPKGPYAAVIPRFFDACKNGSPPVIFGDGEQSRDFTFVMDAIQANLKAALAGKEATGKAYNIGAGDRITVNDLVREVIKITDTHLKAKHEPERAGDVKHSSAAIDRAKQALGYDPTKEIGSGLTETHSFFAAECFQ